MANTGKVLIRYASYTVGMLMLGAALPWVIRAAETDLFREGGPVETLQVCLLVLVIATFLGAGQRLPEVRQLLRLLACVTTVAVLRELDSLLDALIPVVGWKIALLIVVFGAVYAFRHRQLMGDQVRRFVRTRAFALLWTGFLVAIPIGQLVGHGEFLESVMGEDYTRRYKRIVEETLELMGYLILSIGSTEAAMEMSAQTASDKAEARAPHLV